MLTIHSNTVTSMPSGEPVARMLRTNGTLAQQIRYAIDNRMSSDEATRLGFGPRFERTYWRVQCCVAVRISSDWQSRRYADTMKRGGNFSQWLNRNRAVLGLNPL